MPKLSIQRVLSLDLRARRFGYVVFEGPHALLDWGTRTHAEGESSLLEHRLNSLRSMFAPSIILVRKTRETHPGGQSMIRHPLRAVKALAKRVMVVVRVIEGSSLRTYFAKEAKVNKHEIAKMVADQFPELSWRLPPKRKPWETEPARQSIFDAASLGVFYFAQQARV
jgi:hypothetical protein